MQLCRNVLRQVEVVDHIADCIGNNFFFDVGGFQNDHSMIPAQENDIKGRPTQWLFKQNRRFSCMHQKKCLHLQAFSTEAEFHFTFLPRDGDMFAFDIFEEY